MQKSKNFVTFKTLRSVTEFLQILENATRKFKHHFLTFDAILNFLPVTQYLTNADRNI